MTTTVRYIPIVNGETLNEAIEAVGGVMHGFDTAELAENEMAYFGHARNEYEMVKITIERG